MTLNTSRTRPKRNAIGLEEERAWVSFYRRAGKDPAIAAEVVAQLEADIEMKREHLALYLCCRESLRLHQAREARHQRIGHFVRWLLGGLFVRTPKVTGRALGRARDMAVACLPESHAEPASTQVQRIAKNPKVRASRAAFQATAPAGSTPPSMGADAADATPRVVQAGG